MKKKIPILLGLILLAGGFWFANFKYPNDYFLNGFYTFLAFAIIYFVFKILAEEIASRRISDDRTKYSFSKTVSILYLGILVITAILIWIEDPQSLLVAYGLIAAGVAIALQDFFKNFVGGIILFTTRLYRIGDRVEINGKFGDIIDIGIMYTTFLEMKEWIQGDQPTGRIIEVPNGFILSHHVNNYTQDNSFVWDEIHVPITYDSDWKKAIKVILDLVKRKTKDITVDASDEISMLEKKYYLPKKFNEPAIYVALTDNWISLHVRYLSYVRKRRTLHDELSRMILEKVQGTKGVNIASETLDIIGFPGKKK
ncbi:mechanosensitive ion channel [Candidatus Woesearchaeota archaeon]|nr:mechanosensitive ion channel [Candidatus Woesearchaeota archaeon]